MKHLIVMSVVALVMFGCGDDPAPPPVGPTPIPVPSSDELPWSGAIAEGDRIEIKGVIGDVRALAAAGSTTEVSATKSGRTSDPSQVTFAVVEHAGGVTICAVYPTPPGEPPNQCLPGDEGQSNVRDNDVEVDFTVMLPAGVVFVGRTVNGAVAATNVASDVFASTVNGGVSVSTSRHAEATTVNGAVNVSIGVADWDRDLELTSVNGSVTIEVPSDTNARVRASTVNGIVRSDFPLATTLLGNAAEGTIGSGGRLLTLSTVNGDINLNRGAASGG